MGLLTKPNELEMKETYAGLIYGQPGVGKTTLALSGVNPVCIDVDRGMYRVEKRYQVPSLQVENYQQVLDLLNSNELDGFDTIVIDTLGKLIDCMGEYIGKHYPKCRQSNGQLTQQGWGQLKVEFHGLVKLISGKNKSVIFVAHESEDKEGDLTKKRPDVSGSARKDIVKELDFMGYMEISGNKRTISFSPSSAYYAKNSMGLDSVIEIPDIQTTNSFIKTIVVSAIRKRKEQDKAQAGPYDEVIEKINNMVKDIKDVAALNEAYKQLIALNHVWDSKLYAKPKITDAAKALNAVWDKTANLFIGPAVSGPEVPAESGRQQEPSPNDESAARPPEDIERQCHEKTIELCNIMNSESESGERYFTRIEYNIVHKELSTFPKNSPGLRLALIGRLLEEKKKHLAERVEYFEAIDAGKYSEPEQSPAPPAPPKPGIAQPIETPSPGERGKPGVPPIYEEQEPEEETSGATDDGFVDDIPEDTPPKRPPKRTAGRRLPAAAGGELDIF